MSTRKSMNVFYHRGLNFVIECVDCYMCPPSVLQKQINSRQCNLIFVKSAASRVLLCFCSQKFHQVGLGSRLRKLVCMHSMGGGYTFTILEGKVSQNWLISTHPSACKRISVEFSSVFYTIWPCVASRPMHKAHREHSGILPSSDKHSSALPLIETI